MGYLTASGGQKSGELSGSSVLVSSLNQGVGRTGFLIEGRRGIHLLPSSLKSLVGFRPRSCRSEVQDSYWWPGRGRSLLLETVRLSPLLFMHSMGSLPHSGMRPSRASNLSDFSYCHVSLIPAKKLSPLKDACE